jgi:hypothetical protein
MLRYTSSFRDNLNNKERIFCPRQRPALIKKGSLPLWDCQKANLKSLLILHHSRSRQRASYLDSWRKDMLLFLKIQTVLWILQVCSLGNARHSWRSESYTIRVDECVIVRGVDRVPTSGWFNVQDCESALVPGAYSLRSYLTQISIWTGWHDLYNKAAPRIAPRSSFALFFLPLKSSPFAT